MRTTFLIGAGTPLDLHLPESLVSPSTKNITKKTVSHTTISWMKNSLSKLCKKFMTGDGDISSKD